MYFCYIDESGNTGKNLQDRDQPYLCLTAFLVQVENVKSIEDAVRDLSNKLFPESSKNADFELHGDHLVNGRGKYFKGIDLQDRLNTLDKIVDLVLDQEAIKIGYISINKSKYFANAHIQQTAFSLLVEKLEERLKGYLNSYCLLIADEQSELEQKLIDDLDFFKRHGTHFGYNNVLVDRIIDSLHFVKSKNNFLMQLTDIICYLIRRGKESMDRLTKDFLLAKSKEEGLDYQIWINTSANKKDAFYQKMYYKINSKKPWIFAKDFP